MDSVATGLFLSEIKSGKIQGMRTGLKMGGTKFLGDFSKLVFPGKGILPYARFDRDGFLVTGEDDEAVQNGDEVVLFAGEVEEVVGIVEVVKIVGVENIVVQGSMLWSPVLSGRWWRKRWWRKWRKRW